MDTHPSCERAWSSWQPLEGCWREARIPACSGLYRIRIVISLHRMSFPVVVYIGQSGDLRTRMGHFKAVFGNSMPFKSPHIAGPPLWAIRQRLRQERVLASFEVSVMELGDVSRSLRLGYECVAIARQRTWHPDRFLANFGRMPRGYLASTFHKGQASDFHGYPTPRRNDSHLPASVPAGDLERSLPDDLNWCGHHWSCWVAVKDAAPLKETVGLYRLKLANQPEMLYVGQGRVRDRLAPYRREEAVYCSWVGGMWHEHERLALLNDLIASHVLLIGHPPLWQFSDEEGGEKRALIPPAPV
ncbi:hypothetical protein KSF_106860 [Reticulibacter mediterranei]|uniref:GIY-YIG domain-containing protein n=1 Tax=Reticulibacter mediterranei TaxID=2778369 RepID=A0A8J3IU47_9CHLR|nr:hypothetical protein [Reticulibacter mediterranei]GHP00639.1 hypothetical protein KSF_106860 [Reticulibacter mediterranei]